MLWELYFTFMEEVSIVSALKQPRCHCEGVSVWNVSLFGIIDDSDKLDIHNIKSK